MSNKNKSTSSSVVILEVTLFKWVIFIGLLCVLWFIPKYPLYISDSVFIKFALVLVLTWFSHLVIVSAVEAAAETKFHDCHREGIEDKKNNEDKEKNKDKSSMNKPIENVKQKEDK